MAILTFGFAELLHKSESQAHVIPTPVVHPRTGLKTGSDAILQYRFANKLKK